MQPKVGAGVLVMKNSLENSSVQGGPWAIDLEKEKK